METISVLTPYLKENQYVKKQKELLAGDKHIIEFLYEVGTKPLGRAQQNLLQRAKGDFVLLIHDDIELLQNPIPEFLKYIKGNTVGVSACTIELDKTYALHEAVRRTLPAIFPKRRSHFNCALVKKDALLLVGGFNPNLSAGEDNELQIKLNKIGLDIIALKDFVVLHHSTRNYEKEFNYFQGHKYLYNTYGAHQGEADLIDTTSLKFKINLFAVEPKTFVTTYVKKIGKIIKTSLKMPKEIIRNLIYEYNAELLKPDECGLLITENCFFKCQSCEFWKTKKEDSSLDKIKQCIDKLADFGIKKIILLGGEPLMRPDVDEIVDYIKNRGLFCTIITNGALIKTKLKTVLKLDHINVSIDGMESTHDVVRGVTSWSSNLDALYLLKYKYGKDVSVGSVVQDKTHKDLAPLSNLLTAFKIPLYLMCYNTGGMGQPDSVMRYEDKIEYILQNKEKYKLREEQLEYLNLVVKTFKKEVKNQKCFGPNHKIMIDAKGNVYPCSAWSEGIANIHDYKTFKELWNLPAYKNLRIKMKKGTNEFCQNCHSCELTNNFVLGNSYNKKLAKRFINKLNILFS